MKYITLTAEETEQFYSGDDELELEISTYMHEKAYSIREGSETVEIYDNEGILIDVIQD